MNITKSTFSNQQCSSNGGAISNGGTLTVMQSTFYNNSAGNLGGAIANDGKATIDRSTFTGNSAASGGAIANIPPGQITITKSTFSNNSEPQVTGVPGNITTDPADDESSSGHSHHHHPHPHHLNVMSQVPIRIQHSLSTPLLKIRVI